jgi:hypothetical protein
MRRFLHPAPDVAELVEIPNAHCLGRGVPYSRALLMRVGGKEVTLSVDDIDESSEVRGPGDVGTLVIPLWVAYGLRVVDLWLRRGA